MFEGLYYPGFVYLYSGRLSLVVGFKIQTFGFSSITIYYNIKCNIILGSFQFIFISGVI